MTVPKWKTVNPKAMDPFAWASVVRGIMLGRVNCHGTFTLTANAATTAIIAATCRPSSHVTITPTSATAAADQGSATGVYVSTVAEGTFTVTHPNNANADKTFTYGIIG